MESKKNLLTTFKLLSQMIVNSISDREFFSSQFPFGAAIMISQKPSYATDQSSIIGTGK